MPIMWWHIMVAVVCTPLAYQLAYWLLRDNTPQQPMPAPIPLQRAQRIFERELAHEQHMETLRQCFESAGHPVPSMEEAGHNRRIQQWGGEPVHLL